MNYAIDIVHIHINSSLPPHNNYAAEAGAEADAGADTDADVGKGTDVDAGVDADVSTGAGAGMGVGMDAHMICVSPLNPFIKSLTPMTFLLEGCRWGYGCVWYGCRCGYGCVGCGYVYGWGYICPLYSRVPPQPIHKVPHPHDLLGRRL
jgi:hypothetical protein